MPLPQDIERHLTGSFTHGSLGSICASPAQCCFFWFCAPCAVYGQRRRILAVTKEPYVCCAGVWPWCGFNEQKDEACLIPEVICCSGCAMAGNRFMVQTRFNKKNSGMDNVLKVFHSCVGCAFSIGRNCVPCTVEQENICKATCCVCPVTFCQNAAEMDSMLEQGVMYHSPPVGVISELPVHFKAAGFQVTKAPVQQQMV